MINTIIEWTMFNITICCVNLSDFANIAVIIAALTSVIALILNVLKLLLSTKANPYRRKLEYDDKFGDYVSNNGLGSFELINVRFIFNGKYVDHDRLVKLYVDNLGYVEKLSCSCFFSNSEIVGRWLKPGEELRLFELDPKINNLSLERLIKIRNSIAIEIEYKTTFNPIIKNKILN